LNRLQELFTYRQAKLSDQSEIMKFINNFWKPNHILSKDPDFFKYEHVDGSNINFFLAINKKTKSISGILGFIPYGRDLKSHICGVIMQVSPHANVPFLGVEIMRQMLKKTNPQTYCGIGTDPKTMIPLVKTFFKREVGIMDHYFYLNPALNEFQIIKISKIDKNHLEKTGFNNVISLNNIQLADEKLIVEHYEQLFIEANLPRKSLEYVLKRYLNHPIYSYKSYLICDSESGNQSLLFAREVEYSGSTVLRIIDFLGDVNVLGKLNVWLDSIISDNCYEYIDILCSGIDQKLFEGSGFKLVKDVDIIVPTYFEPFICENIDIYFEKSHQDLILFKGDADGDRPNKVHSIKKN